MRMHDFEEALRQGREIFNLVLDRNQDRSPWRRGTHAEWETGAHMTNGAITALFYRMLHRPSNRAPTPFIRLRLDGR